MAKKNCIGTGLSGLIGSRLVELLSDRFQFEDLSYDTGVDITDKDAVFSRLKKNDAPWVLHMAAKADVESCEQDKPHHEQGMAWKINVIGTKNIVDLCNALGKKVIYISTDFVFDGNKDVYTEEDIPHPVNWYAHTKYEGEKIVGSEKNNIIMRIAYPYRTVNTQKQDFVHSLLSAFKKQQLVKALSDHIFTPTFIDDIAHSLALLIEKNACGIYHVVGSESLTPYEAAQKLAASFHFRQDLISPITIEEYYRNRAVRPKKLRLSNNKIQSLGMSLLGFSEGLRVLQEQGITV